MAGRKEKHTVDYFPFYVKDGRTLFILESKYGCKGTGFFTNVLRFLCLTPDHHICISRAGNADRLFFFSKMHCDEESGTDMLNIMADMGKINKDLWLQKNVIYSEDLIASLTEAYRQRSNKPFDLDKIYAFYQLTTKEMECPAGEIDISSPVAPSRQRLFDKLWQAYPKKRSIGQAEKTFSKLNPDERLVSAMIAKIEQARTSEGWLKDKGRYIPYLSTWLNDRGWMDEIEAAASGPPCHPSSSAPSPYVTCEYCGNEHLPEDVADYSGKRICPKCPESREMAREAYNRLSGMASGIRAMP